MSHFADIETEITDRDALVLALVREGYTENQIEIHDIPQKLGGYDQTDLKAEVIIRRHNVRYISGYKNYNDIGFSRKNGKFRIHSDDMYDKQFGTRISTFYNVEKTKQELRRRKIRFTEEVDDQNRIRLRAKM